MKCQLCDDYKGAIVYANYLREKRWSWFHIVCVNYMPSLWFVEKQEINAIGVTETVKDTELVDGKVLKSL